MNKYLIILFLPALFFTSCSSSSSYEETIIEVNCTKESNTTYSTKEKLGRALFFDKCLSKRGTQSCGTCHNPDTAFVDQRSNSLMSSVQQAVSLGDDGKSIGDRNAPMAAYAMYSPDFLFTAGVIKGGQFHDGRAKNLKEQAGGPPLNPIEMGMATKEDVVDRLKENTAYVKAFKNLYNIDLNEPEISYDAMSEAIAKFEKTDLFNPFDSKYDRYLKGDYNLSSVEKQGMDLFFNSSKTNCSNCHVLAANSKTYNKEVFSTFEFFNIGVPINGIVQNKRKELGLINSFINDIGALNNPAVTQEQHRGKFKTPILRNVAVTWPYMHNGVFQKLSTVLKFYEHQRGNSNFSINPETNKPWESPENLDSIDIVHLPRGVDLTQEQLDSIEAFLKILTDKRYEHLIPKE